MVAQVVGLVRAVACASGVRGWGYVSRLACSDTSARLSSLGLEGVLLGVFGLLRHFRQLSLGLDGGYCC